MLLPIKFHDAVRAVYVYQEVKSEFSVFQIREGFFSVKSDSFSIQYINYFSFPFAQRIHLLFLNK